MNIFCTNDNLFCVCAETEGASLQQLSGTHEYQWQNRKQNGKAEWGTALADAILGDYGAIIRVCMM